MEGAVRRNRAVIGVDESALSRLPAVDSADGLRAVAERDGAVFVRGLVPVERVTALRDQALAFAEQAGWLDESSTPDRVVVREGVRVGEYEAPSWVELQARVQGRSEFWELGGAPEVESLVRAAVPTEAAPYLSLANTVRAFSPHPELATPPHQDGHFVRNMGEFWTLWIPLCRCPLPLGPLAVSRGSHRAGPVDHTDEGVAHVADGARWGTAEFRCGDALLFHCRTLHRALPNRTARRLRLSADFRFGLDAGSPRAQALRGPPGTWPADSTSSPGLS